MESTQIHLDEGTHICAYVSHPNLKDVLGATLATRNRKVNKLFLPSSSIQLVGEKDIKINSKNDMLREKTVEKSVGEKEKKTCFI